MTMPSNVRIVDTMMAVPTGDHKRWYKFLSPLLRDAESHDMEFPVEYMFKDVPKDDRFSEGPDVLLREMNHWNVERAMIDVSFQNPKGVAAVSEHPDRFIPCFGVDPNQGMDGVRELVRAHDELGAIAASAFPCGLNPQVPINDRRFYPIYAKCVELDIPIFVCAGIPGPRVPYQPQYVGHIDDVCYDFPELRFVTRHGCEPWTDLMVKLMLKWPNLYYSTSAFAPKYYPRDIVDYANTRGADRVIYAGYFPIGLSLERIMTEMPNVPFKDDVWPKFLRENALRVLKLDT
jgi:predicted TIM-barrel fold metal-dependent hydrolase